MMPLRNRGTESSWSAVSEPGVFTVLRYASVVSRAVMGFDQRAEKRNAIEPMRVTANKVFPRSSPVFFPFLSCSLKVGSMEFKRYVGRMKPMSLIRTTKP